MFSFPDCGVLILYEPYLFLLRKELVFCGYGEPTCALHLMLQTARYVKKIHPQLKLRVNTNGLGNLENRRDIVPDLAQVLDAVSISLNAPDEADYNKVTRPTLPGAYEAMLDFARECRKAIPDTGFISSSFRPKCVTR